MSKTTGRPRYLPWTLLATVGLGYSILAAHAERQEASGERDPATLIGAEMPETPPLASSGGEVLLELWLDDAGQVTEVSTLTDTPPFTDHVVSAVRAWRFQPAQSEGEPVASRVLVAAYYREPAFYSSTTAGEPPRVVGRGSSAIPYPEHIVTPPFPPMAYDGGAALLSVRVGPMGDVEEAEVVRSTSGFEQAAVDAVRQWEFEPAEAEGVPVPTFAYVIVGFRQPVVP